MSNVKEVARVCGLCESTCGLLFTVDGPKVLEVRGNPDDVFSKGFICPKGASHGALASDPDRLRAPMVRENGRLIKTTWDHAFALIAERLADVRNRHGRNSVAFYRGNPMAHTISRPFVAAVTPMLSPNVYSAMTADTAAMFVACSAVFGNAAARPVPDIDRTDLLVILGANPMESNGSVCTAPDFPGRLRALKSRGGRLVVVDPRRTRTAKVADEYLAIIPGADSFLLLALVHELIKHRTVLPVVPRVSPRQMDELAALVSGFSPVAVEQTTGISAERIRALAEDIRSARTCAVYGRIGVSTAEDASLASWLIQVINIITGNLDSVGGSMFPRQPTRPTYQVDRPFVRGDRHSRVRGLREVAGEFPMATMADEILVPGEGQIRALFTIAGNPGRSAPNGPRVAEALADLDLLVCIDPYINETTRHADVILPPPPSLTSRHYDWLMIGMSVRTVLRYSERVVDLPPDALSEVEILSHIAVMLGDGLENVSAAEWRQSFIDKVVADAVIQQESPVFGAEPAKVIELLEGDDDERYLDLLLRLGPFGDGFGSRPGGVTLSKLKENPNGMDYGPMVPRIDEMLLHEDGQYDLVPADLMGEALKLRLKLDAERSPFLLIGRRDLRSSNSWLHNIPQLVAGKDVCTLLMNTADAIRLELGFGEMVTLVGPRGEVDVQVEITEDIREGVVSLPHGWGHPEILGGQRTAASTRGVSVNDLTDERVLDALSGNAVFSGIPVTIRRIGRQSSQLRGR